MSPPKYLNPGPGAAAARIIDLLTNHCTTPSHLQEIQKQLIRYNLRSDTTVAHHFITACQSFHLLNSVAFPLYITTTHPPPHIFTCNTLLKAFSHSTSPQNAPLIFSYMHKNSIKPNNYTFPFLLKALADLKLISLGTCVHSHIVKFGFSSDIYVGNSLLNFYAAVGEMGLCGKVFDEMPLRDVVSWTVLISGFRKARRFEEALIAFERMRGDNVVPNRVTAVNALAACACIGALDMGVWIHEHVRRSGWEVDVILGSSLVDLYGKCGRMDEALRVFGEMSVRSVYTWNAVINGLALCKRGNEAIGWFYKIGDEGIRPDESTLVSVLSACVQSGLVHVGNQIFCALVVGRFGLPPSVKHYACMIDLLARSRCLDDAFRIIYRMPFEPTTSMWGSLLTGCKAQAYHDLSEVAAWKLVALEPQNPAYYVALSNLYAEMGKWNDVQKVRELMKERGLRKDRGSSTAELEYKNRALVA